jgi:hypothetical protein
MADAKEVSAEAAKALVEAVLKPALKSAYQESRDQLLTILKLAGIEAQSIGTWIVEKAIVSMLLFYAAATSVKEVRDLLWCIFPFCFKRPA